LVFYVTARAGEDEGRQVLNALIWGVSEWAITALAVKLFTHLSAWESIGATLPLAFILFSTVIMNGRNFFRMLGGGVEGNPWDEIAPTDYHIALWKSIPPATAYAQQCFLSGVPFMLQRDIEALKYLMNEHQQQLQQQATEKRRCAVAQQFFAS
jgi:hypothetical protein